MTKLPDVMYRILRNPQAKLKIVHFDRMKPYEGSTPDEWLTATERHIDDPRPMEEPQGPDGNEISPSDVEAQVVCKDPRSSRYPQRKRKRPNYFYW